MVTIGVRAGDGTQRVNGGTEYFGQEEQWQQKQQYLRQQNLYQRQYLRQHHRQCIASSMNRSISCGMERPGVVAVNSDGSRGGASLAVVVMVEAKRPKRCIVYFEASLSMVSLANRTVCRAYDIGSFHDLPGPPHAPRC